MDTSGNPDLQGRAVEDRNLESVAKRQSIEPVLPVSTEDQYSGIPFNNTPAYSEAPSVAGAGDSYGSIMHSVGFSYDAQSSHASRPKGGSGPLACVR